MAIPLTFPIIQVKRRAGMRAVTAYDAVETGMTRPDPIPGIDEAVLVRLRSVTLEGEDRRGTPCRMRAVGDLAVRAGVLQLKVVDGGRVGIPPQRNPRDRRPEWNRRIAEADGTAESLQGSEKTRHRCRIAIRKQCQQRGIRRDEEVTGKRVAARVLDAD